MLTAVAKGRGDSAGGRGKLSAGPRRFSRRNLLVLNNSFRPPRLPKRFKVQNPRGDKQSLTVFSGANPAAAGFRAAGGGGGFDSGHAQDIAVAILPTRAIPK